MACATCHSFTQGGADARRARHPGADGVFNTADDVLRGPDNVLNTADDIPFAFGSPGVIHSNSLTDFIRGE